MNSSITSSTGLFYASFVMPKLEAGEEIHIILEVKDTGRPALYSYRRIVLKQ